MADTTPQKRELPPRERRESAAKRRASSPAQPPSTASTPTARTPPTAGSSPATGRKTGYIRGPYKKRASIAQIQTPTSGSRSSPSVSISGDVLPTRMIVNKALPTTKQKPLTRLSLKEYQSVAESAVLAASLYQSRMQWLYNGIFEKYYVKKRKGVEVPPNNPDIKSMQRLGPATLTVEPHTFDVFFYLVRDVMMPAPHQPHPNQHSVKQMGPPSHPTPSSGYPPQNSNLPPQIQPPKTPTSVSVPPLAVKTSTPAQSASVQAPTLPASAAHNAPPSSPAKQDESARPAPAPSEAAPSAPTPQPSPKPFPPQPAKGSTQDPVIQMLAARAASDPQLKELMKIVATSKASPEQLKEFQSHIDEFNEVIRRQEAERAAKSEEARPKQPTSSEPVSQTPQPPPNAPFKTSVPLAQNAVTPSAKPQVPGPAQPSTRNVAQTQPRQHPAPATTPAIPRALPGVVHTFPTPPPPAGRGGPAGGPAAGYTGYPPPPAVRPEPYIKHVVMELSSVPSGSHAPCPDRWLFPEYAVLEMRPNGLDMICSFLVGRKGSQIMSGTSVDSATSDNGTQGLWQAEQEYYQPVTMTIRARDHKIIQTIAKAAKTLPVVQEYMKDVMSKKQRAPVGYLVHQLPRDKGRVVTEIAEAGFVDSGVEVSSESPSEDDELKDFYGI